MPSEEQNIQYLYLVLTHGGTPMIDWDPICAALQLERGAVTKRWSRLKQAMGKGEKPTASNYEFLWLLVKHSTRDQPFDWDAIASQCNSTKGACSKRYSRLKIAFERGDAPPTTPAKGDKSVPATPKKTPQKAKVKTEGDKEGTLTITPKRKRTPAKKKVADAEDDEEEEEEEDAKPKRAKSTSKATSKPKPKNGFRASDQEKEVEVAQTAIKDELDEDDGDVFLDAPEQAAADADVDEVLPASIFSEAFTHAREIANVLLNRKTDLTEAHRDELEGMFDVFGEAE